MLSLSRSLGLGLFLAGIATPFISGLVSAQTVEQSTQTTAPGAAAALGTSYVTIDYDTGDEELYFSGDGTSSTKALVGVLVDWANNQGISTPIDPSGQTSLNGLFPFYSNPTLKALQSTTGIHCCYPQVLGTVQPPVTCTNSGVSATGAANCHLYPTCKKTNSAGVTTSVVASGSTVCYGSTPATAITCTAATGGSTVLFGATNCKNPSCWYSLNGGAPFVVHDFTACSSATSPTYGTRLSSITTPKAPLGSPAAPQNPVTGNPNYNTWTNYVAASSNYVVPAPTTQHCTPDATQTLVIQDAVGPTPAAGASYIPLSTPVKVTCSGTANDIWVDAYSIQSTSAPIQGELSWVADPIAGGSATVPFLTGLSINSNVLTNGITQSASDPTNALTTWLQFATTANGLNLAAADANGFLSWQTSAASIAQVEANSNGVDTYAPLTLNPDGTVASISLVDVLGCVYASSDSTGKTVYQTVNDQTVWPAPASDQLPANVFSPVCYFEAVHVNNPGLASQTTSNAVVVSIAVTITVSGTATDPMSSQTYHWDDVNAAIQSVSATSKVGAAAVPDFFSSAEVALKQGGEDDILLSTGATTTKWPFYSTVFAASGFAAGINQNPIGSYFSTLTSATTGAPDGTVPIANLADVNHPILCFENVNQPLIDPVSGGPLLDSTGNPVYFDPTADSILVNDETDFSILGGSTNAISLPQYIQCTVWDLAGQSQSLLYTLIVRPPLPPAPTPPCSGNSQHGVLGTHGSGCGDPQFSGFLGQSYQVHGVSNQVYNILSTPSFQYNALFTYLSSGSCRAGTQCFAHPGNYFGEVGMLVKSADGTVYSIRVVAGSVNAGLTVFVNNEQIAVSTESVKVADLSLTLSTAFELEVQGKEFSLRLANSDMFINQDVSINTPLLRSIQHFKQAVKSSNATVALELEQSLPHGLLGQTWQYKTYPNRWKFIEGTLFEYSVSDGVTGTDFKYNRF